LPPAASRSRPYVEQCVSYLTFCFYLLVLTKDAVSRLSGTNHPTLRQLRAAINLAIKRPICGQAEIFAGPCAQINVFAARTAKRTKGIARRVNAGALTVWAHHLLERQGIIVHGIAYRASAAKRQFKRRIVDAGVQAAIALLAHEAY